MATLNKVLLIGNLTRDVEVRYTPAGKAVGSTGLAVNRQWTNDAGQKQEETTFVDLTLWGKTAETAAQYVGKGSQVHVEGRLKLEEWQDKNTGEKRTKMIVVADGLLFLGAPRGQSERPARPAREPQRQSSPPPYADAQAAADGDEIPF
jgi:single-strand DNA-binding protein